MSNEELDGNAGTAAERGVVQASSDFAGARYTAWFI
jgi:hypothetical protein